MTLIERVCCVLVAAQAVACTSSGESESKPALPPQCTETPRQTQIVVQARVGTFGVTDLKRGYQTEPFPGDFLRIAAGSGGGDLGVAHWVNGFPQHTLGLTVGTKIVTTMDERVIDNGEGEAATVGLRVVRGEDGTLLLASGQLAAEDAALGDSHSWPSKLLPELTAVPTTEGSCTTGSSVLAGTELTFAGGRVIVPPYRIVHTHGLYVFASSMMRYPPESRINHGIYRAWQMTLNVMSDRVASE